MLFQGNQFSWKLFDLLKGSVPDREQYFDTEKASSLFDLCTTSFLIQLFACSIDSASNDHTQDTEYESKICF